MNIFDRYIFKNISFATIFVSMTLIVIVFLTQSLRFLELVIDSGASTFSFWALTMLALPRFLEILVPLSLVAGVVFVYNRMASDSELSVIKSLGRSSMSLAKPALFVAVLATLFLFAMTMWVAPKSLSSMQHLRQVVKAQFSALLLREGVFNVLGDGLTVYIRERVGDQELLGIMIHDARAENENPSTIFAKNGAIVRTDDLYQVVVYNGSRQEIDPKSNVLRRLDFERYVIDLPDSGPVRERWQQPDERTIFELLRPDVKSERDVENVREFFVELHRRFCSPFLAAGFTAFSCALLLLGPVSRRGHVRRIFVIIMLVMVLEGLFLASANLARQSNFGLVLMYLTVFFPLFSGLFFLSSFSEKFRFSFFFPRIKKMQERKA